MGLHRNRIAIDVDAEVMRRPLGRFGQPFVTISNATHHALSLHIGHLLADRSCLFGSISPMLGIVNQAL